VPSEYKRVVGSSFRKLVLGCIKIQATKRIIMQKTINLIIILSDLVVDLVAVGKSTHSGHDSEDVVVHCIHSEVEGC
jgi:hypothetical protein